MPHSSPKSRTQGDSCQLLSTPLTMLAAAASASLKEPCCASSHGHANPASVAGASPSASALTLASMIWLQELASSGASIGLTFESARVDILLCHSGGTRASSDGTSRGPSSETSAGLASSSAIMRETKHKAAEQTKIAPGRWLGVELRTTRERV
eukprot:scaffold16867_cov67-Phaeocystis_antarctica.AAC.6